MKHLWHTSPLVHDLVERRFYASTKPEISTILKYLSLSFCILEYHSQASAHTVYMVYVKGKRTTSRVVAYTRAIRADLKPDRNRANTIGSRRPGDLQLYVATFPRHRIRLRSDVSRRFFRVIRIVARNTEG